MLWSIILPFHFLVQCHRRAGGSDVNITMILCYLSRCAAVWKLLSRAYWQLFCHSWSSSHMCVDFERGNLIFRHSKNFAATDKEHKFDFCQRYVTTVGKHEEEEERKNASHLNIRWHFSQSVHTFKWGDWWNSSNLKIYSTNRWKKATTHK